MLSSLRAGARWPVWALITAALLLVPVRRSEACHLPVDLRLAKEKVTPAQLALVAHGSSQRAQIPYKLAAITSCAGGKADIFPCKEVDLLAHLPLAEIGGGSGNDIWGWRDPRSGREYALVGRSNGTAFIDMTDPEEPIYIGNLQTHALPSAWRDIKVYKNHAFIVADFAGIHGMQVFDLTRLRGVGNPPVEFSAQAHYDGFERAHNIVINEATGFAYAVGSETCNDGGLHMIDISNPLAPAFVGCFGDDGYTHDAQCVVYQGPDADYRGREICVASNENSVTVVDVTVKNNPQMLSRNPYQGSGYTHQGWLTEDHAYFLQDDELDERRFGHNTKTYVWDMADLEAPKLAGIYMSEGSSIDHNQYVLGNHTYQANYRRGLRILELTDPARGKLEEVAYFDTYPDADGRAFDGAWSAYPFLDSGAVVVSDINRGLFILRPRISNRIFADDFESKGVANWSGANGTALSIVEPGLRRSSAALGLTIDGGAEPSFVTSKHPARETTFTASLLLAARKVDLGGERVEILRLLSGRKIAASLTLEKIGNRYSVGLWGNDAGTLVLLGSGKIPQNRAVALRLEWASASSANGADGVARLIRRKRTVAESVSLTNGRLVVDTVRLGLPDGAAGGSGTFVIDDYVSTP